MILFDLTTWLYSKVTFTRRYRPEIKWSRHSWTHNAFRAFELVFGRKFGIRKESSTGHDGVNEIRRVYTIEAALAFVEEWIRGKVPKFKLVEVCVPQLAFAGGMRSQPIGYMFAIAYDNSAKGEVTLGTSVTLSNTCSGSDIALVAFATDNGARTVTATATKGGSATSMTLINRAAGGGLGDASFYILSPDTGVGSNVVFSISSSGYIVAECASYTGVSQTGFPDNSVINAYNGAGSATISQSITPVADNCWAIMGGFYNANSGTVTAGANTTVRQSQVNASGLNGFGDSNSAITPAASYTLNMTGTVAGRSSQLITMAPSGSAPPATVVDVPRLLTMGVG